MIEQPCRLVSNGILELGGRVLPQDLEESWLFRGAAMSFCSVYNVLGPRKSEPVTQV